MVLSLLEAAQTHRRTIIADANYPSKSYAVRREGNGMNARARGGGDFQDYTQFTLVPLSKLNGVKLNANRTYPKKTCSPNSTTSAMKQEVRPKRKRKASDRDGSRLYQQERSLTALWLKHCLCGKKKRTEFRYL